MFIFTRHSVRTFKNQIAEIILIRFLLYNTGIGRKWKKKPLNLKADEGGFLSNWTRQSAESIESLMFSAFSLLSSDNHRSI